MSDKPGSLRLADELIAPVGTQSTYGVMRQAAACLRRQHAEIESLKAECEALRAEVSALQSQVNAFYLGTPESRLLAMTKERDALRADAERYRWLRSDVATAENYPIACMRDGGWLLLGDELDAAIDAAREAGK